MRSIATAAAFAIAASLAAGQESGKSGKSGTKSSKSGDCTDCTAGTLTRATTVTNLVYSNFADENGDITQASIAEFCNAGPDATQAFVDAIDNTAGCLVAPKCLAQRLLHFLHLLDPDTPISEGEFQLGAVDVLCEAEQNDVPIEECDYTDPCEAINNNDLSSMLATLDDLSCVEFDHELGVIHMPAGITALVAAKILGPRI